jgi:hypothetical protein
MGQESEAPRIKELNEKYIGFIDKEIKEQTFDNFSNVPRNFQQIKTMKSSCASTVAISLSVQEKCCPDTVKLILELPINIPVTNLKLRVYNPNKDKLRAEVKIKSGNCQIDMVKINMLMGNIVMDLSQDIENVDGYTWISLPFFKNSYISSTDKFDLESFVFNTVVLVIENANFICDNCELFGDVLELPDPDVNGLQKYKCLTYQNKYITECFNSCVKMGRKFSRGICLGKGWDIKCRLPFSGPICSIFVYISRPQTELVNDIYLMIDDYKLQMQETEFGYQVVFSQDETSTINFSKIDNAFLIMNTYIVGKFYLNVHAINLQVSNLHSSNGTLLYGHKYAF